MTTRQYIGGWIAYAGASVFLVSLAMISPGLTIGLLIFGFGVALAYEKKESK